MIALRLALASALIASSALPVDRGLDDFDGVVKQIESHYRKKRVWIPLMASMSSGPARCSRSGRDES